MEELALIAGKYRIDAEIGRGGMGIVYAATHVGLEQRVAIKVLPSSAIDDAEATSRLLREARAAARIRSEHVVRVMDVGTLEDGRPYVVMEHLQGIDIASRLADADAGNVDIVMAVGWMLEACLGLAAAHAAGIVHRDVKPANMFLARQPDRSEIVKVLDFGISKVQERQGGLLGPDGTITETGRLFGSPAYMSPEQLYHAAQVDPRSDIWSCGAVLYELLTGCPPFGEGPVAKVLAAIGRDDPEPLRGRRADIPEELERVVLHCLMKEPDERPKDVAELAKALAPFGPKNAEDFAEKTRRTLEHGGDDPPSVDREVAASALSITPKSTAKRSPRFDAALPGEQTSAPIAKSVREPSGREAEGLGRRRLLALAVVVLGAAALVMTWRSSEGRPRPGGATPLAPISAEVALPAAPPPPAPALSAAAPQEELAKPAASVAPPSKDEATAPLPTASARAGAPKAPATGAPKKVVPKDLEPF